MINVFIKSKCSLMFLNRVERTLKFADLTLDKLKTQLNDIKLHESKTLIEIYIIQLNIYRYIFHKYFCFSF